ncbi:MAG: hypothetical protein DRP08_07655 [Candidatus Aenigmatarchaeota archaeon]|nr:MAG: hypothetical protein DRP08_07655 [Candidatus Aenigmarchaeota archaeon]
MEALGLLSQFTYKQTGNFILRSHFLQTAPSKSSAFAAKKMKKHLSRQEQTNLNGEKNLGRRKQRKKLRQKPTL